MKKLSFIMKVIIDDNFIKILFSVHYEKMSKSFKISLTFINLWMPLQAGLSSILGVVLRSD